MKKLNLFTGGHPFQVDDISTLQDGIIDALNGIGTGLGNAHGAYILTGCVQTGLTMSSGYIFFQNEVFPVDAQPMPILALGMQVYWQVQEVTIAPSPVTYQDTTSHNVHVRRRMIVTGAFVAPPNSIVFPSIPRLNQVLGLTPQRGIIMYSGSTSNFTAGGLGKAGTQLDGWALCNGGTFQVPGSGGATIVTPDLRGRFLVGYDPTDPDYNTIGNTGGSKTVVLTAAQLPPHTHLLSPDTQAIGINDGTGVLKEVLTLNGDANMPSHPGSFGLGSAHASEDGTANGLVSAPHANRPPYYTIAYIFKLL